MSSDPLHDYGQQLLEREWRKRMLVRGGSEAAASAPPPATLMRDLIDMVGENPARHAGELQPVVERMLVETQFVDDNGDSMLLAAGESSDLQARLLVQMLEEVRQYALNCGIWSTEPVTPMMFG